MRIIPFILYLFLLGLHQVVLKEFTSIYSVSINLAALMVILVALYQREREAAWFGFAVGLTMGAADPAAMGWYALIYTAVGLASYHVRRRLNLESRHARLTLVGGGLLLASLVQMVLIGLDGFFARLLTEVLAGTVYTGIIGWLFFLAKEGVISYRRFKTLF